MSTGLSILELLDACIDESTRVVERGVYLPTGEGLVELRTGYDVPQLRIIENQVVMMRVLRELRGRI